MTTTGRPAAQLTVMVVDDDPMIVRVVERILSRSGVTVVATRRSMGVLNLIATNRPAIVLLDVNMPGLGGPSLVKLIREDPDIQGTTVLLHSALEEGPLAEKARECGADGYIAKAFGVPHLEKSLERWLAARRP